MTLYDRPVRCQNSRERLDNVAKRVQADGKDGWAAFTAVLKAPVTRDGHRWRVGYQYKTSHGYIVVILLPRQVNDVSARHIAMYTRGWSEKDPPPLLSEIAENFAWTLEVKGF